MESMLPGLDAAANIHPLFVHFPIALWLSTLLFWGAALTRKSSDLWRIGRWLLYLGTLGGVAAVVTGLIASEGLGHDAPGHDLVHLHRNFMLVTTGLAAITVALAFVWRRSSSAVHQWVLALLLAVTAVVMTLGADRGAELVFRHGIGTAGSSPAGDHEHDMGHEHDR